MPPPPRTKDQRRRWQIPKYKYVGNPQLPTWGHVTSHFGPVVPPCIPSYVPVPVYSPAIMSGFSTTYCPPCPQPCPQPCGRKHPCILD
ncbi:unnamed protein product [Phyllotreta striolata]|uniref:Uncharacterized protein n=1 Tax=Phyllotreta striolata TaxID=444603 RepID=A0A9P0DSV6_PHYSR|nr:unnamed protein product [Phyllotreta striolata]